MATAPPAPPVTQLLLPKGADGRRGRVAVSLKARSQRAEVGARLETHQSAGVAHERDLFDVQLVPQHRQHLLPQRDAARHRRMQRPQRLADPHPGLFAHRPAPA